MHVATVDLVAAGGYDTLTATAIARTAGVSKRTFYEHFDDKDDCFFATYDRIVEYLARAVLGVRRGGEDRSCQLRRGLSTFTADVASHPRAARLALVEVFAAGPRAAGRVKRTARFFEEQLTSPFREGEDGLLFPPILAKGVVGGCAQVARVRLLAGREHSLVRETEALERWALSLCQAEAAIACPARRDAVRCGRAADTVLPRGAAGWNDPDFDDDREMILRAMTELACAEGYRSLTVPRIRRAAGISRQRFESHFNGVDDCFLAGLELMLADSLRAPRVALVEAPDWRAGVPAALDALCRRFAANQDLIRLAFFEVATMPGQAARWRADFVAGLARMLSDGAPDAQLPPGLAAEASAGAVWALLDHYAKSGGATRLEELVPPLVYLVLAPVIGAPAAVETIKADPYQKRFRPIA
jgi:AcrR family transcriptional regulator